MENGKVIVLDFGENNISGYGRFIVISDDLGIEEQLKRIFTKAENAIIIDAWHGCGRVEFKYEWYDFEYHVAKSFL